MCAKDLSVVVIQACVFAPRQIAKEAVGTLRNGGVCGWFPKPAEPKPNRDFKRAPLSAVRAILDDLPIHIRPNLPAARVQNITNPMGSSHYGASMIASSALCGQ